MTDAPKTIWAVTEPNDESAQILGEVYAQQVPDGMVGKPAKYLRADTVAAQLKAADELAKAMEWLEESTKDYSAFTGNSIPTSNSNFASKALAAYRKGK